MNPQQQHYLTASPNGMGRPVLQTYNPNLQTYTHVPPPVIPQMAYKSHPQHHQQHPHQHVQPALVPQYSWPPMPQQMQQHNENAMQTAPPPQQHQQHQQQQQQQQQQHPQHPQQQHQPKQTPVPVPAQNQMQAQQTPIPAPIAAVPAPIPAPKTNSRKRKSDVVDPAMEALFPPDYEARMAAIDEDDQRIKPIDGDTANSVRRRIRAWTESGAMKVGEFQRTINCSSRAYSRFMGYSGTHEGSQSDVYWNALEYFKKRELLGLANKKDVPKKPKTKESIAKANNLLDVTSVTLPFNQHGQVSVYDTCGEIRKKISAFLKHEGITQAAFLKEISRAYPEPDKTVSTQNLRYFMGRKGPVEGNTNPTFYAAYVFFEKKRIKDGKAKSKTREEMERVHGPDGMDVVNNLANGHFLMHESETMRIDKYGKVHFEKRY